MYFPIRKCSVPACASAQCTTEKLPRADVFKDSFSSSLAYTAHTQAHHLGCQRLKTRMVQGALESPLDGSRRAPPTHTVHCGLASYTPSSAALLSQSKERPQRRISMSSGVHTSLLIPTKPGQKFRVRQQQKSNLAHC